MKLLGVGHEGKNDEEKMISIMAKGLAWWQSLNTPLRVFVPELCSVR